jgi:hypothetical protein
MDAIGSVLSFVASFPGFASLAGEVLSAITEMIGFGNSKETVCPGDFIILLLGKASDGICLCNCLPLP